MVAIQKLREEKSWGRGGSIAPRPALHPSPLDEAARVQVYRQWRLGTSLDVLATQSGLSRAAIDRVINDVRAHHILEKKLEWMYDPSFDEPGADGVILGPTPAGPQGSGGNTKAPAGLPPHVACLYTEAPLLTREQEAHLFRKMNYLKYRAAMLREPLDPAGASASELDEIERLQEEALSVKNQIIRANLRLVVSIAKRRVGPGNDLFELVSDGNMSLIRAVEKFDFSRGFKFSTYASWAIERNFSRAIPAEKSRRDRFASGHGEIFDAAADYRTDESEREDDHRRHQEAIRGMLGRLDDRERQILTSRYGLGGSGAMTLEQLGRVMGITKERVRQIASKAHEKLRTVARELRLDPPAP